MLTINKKIPDYQASLPKNTKDFMNTDNINWKDEFGSDINDIPIGLPDNFPKYDGFNKKIEILEDPINHISNKFRKCDNKKRPRNIEYTDIEYTHIDDLFNKRCNCITA